ncbi:distal tail protein Dit [Lysinibacillus sp. NPDC096418]|uniref:distal tail protein Dit n=1 Tax=Lysinibacillus sp. NPDC096418 TaxID=3364138 RepID=UPI003812BE4A
MNKDGRKTDISKYSLKRLYHFIPSITMSHQLNPVDGGIGSIISDTRYESRIITVRFLYESYDIQDYYLLRDEINALFTRDKFFYIIFKNESYKRYKVRLNGNFLVTPAQYMEQFDVEFICEDLYAESISTTRTHKEWDLNRWAWNGEITWDDDLRYAFTTNEFTVKNLGNVTIDPRQVYCMIEIEGIFASGVTITNKTTGDVYHYSGPIDDDDMLILDGVRTFYNGESRFFMTNKRLLTLVPGDNNFIVTGGRVDSIIFDFKFLYL